jgi:uracil-DNA glycosylase family protein
MAPSAAPVLHPATTLADVPAGERGLELARRVAAACTACDLHAHATQTVFGEGRSRASLMLVGEQPGDREDREGEPFVGPAGAMLDRALADAGIDRERVFVTNVVKHFKWRPVPGSKRRLHEKPNAVEIRACRPWLDLELQIVRPDLVVALGATAAQTILGPSFRITEGRGELLEAPAIGRHVIATFHPSAILRARTPADRERMLAALVADLALAADTIRAA